MTITWTTHQQAVFDWAATGTGSAVIEAVAGAGKTTVLVEMLKHLKGGTALCAFNKRIADELKARTSGMKGVFAGTLHSAGFSAVRRAVPNVKVNDKKIYEIINAFVNLDEGLKVYAPFVNKLVGLAKDSGVGFFNSIEDRQVWQDIIDHHDLSMDNEFSNYDEAITFAINVLKKSNDNREVIDFADMIYHVLIHNYRVWQNDNVLLDECQDTNPTRRALARKMLKPGGRLIAVGDPFQAIMGFSGADNDAMDQIKRDFGAVTLPLTTSFRCPVAVVNHARQWVSHITSSPNAPAGTVSSLAYADFLTNAESLGLKGESAILCRKNGPLLELAFALIRKGIACRMEGRDIGMQLVNLARKWKVKSLDKLADRLEAFRDREIQKALAKGNDAKAEQIADRCDCLSVLIDRAQEKMLDVDGLVNMIMDMFSDTDPNRPSNILVLSSIHRAKGLEWNRVFLLGREQFQPSKWARQQWMKDQERNLIYVGITRAKETLIEINGVPE